MGETGDEFFDGGVDDTVAVLERGVILECQFSETVFEVGKGGGVEVVCCDAVIAGCVCLVC